jgi:hypothetical protein
MPDPDQVVAVVLDDHVEIAALWIICPPKYESCAVLLRKSNFSRVRAVVAVDHVESPFTLFATK